MNAESKIRYIPAKDAAGLKTMVSKAIAGYGKARIAVQVAIIAIMCHAAKHNDYSQANALVAGLGQSKTARDVATFFRDFCGLEAKPAEDGTKPDGFNSWQGPAYIAEHLDAAKAQMFWLYKQPKGDVFTEYTLEELAQDFIKRHDRAVKAAKDGKATLDDSISEVTMRRVLGLVKFDAIAVPAVKEAKVG